MECETRFVVMTYGASEFGYKYALAIFVPLETAVHNATATARLAFGRGIVDETQDRMSWNIEKEPIAWRNMAYR